MNSATAPLKPPPPAGHAPLSSGRAGAPFVEIRIFDDLDAARETWGELESLSSASPYQSFAFASAWFATLGAAQGAKPHLIAALDERGAPVALLPFCRNAYGPPQVAAFLGGKHANFNLGLFRPGGEWDRHAIEALLTGAARVAKPRIDLYRLLNQPVAWQGAANPLSLLAGKPSPSCGRKSELPRDFEAWCAAHFSKQSRKKLRKKASRLAETAELRHEIARDARTAERFLAAFVEQKRDRFRRLGRAAANAYDSADAEAFLARLATAGPAGAPLLELHALTLGERVIATFGAMASRDRLSGLVIAFDGAEDIARCSPGELLVIEAARSAIERGFRTFDLGVGESRYKAECCETPEPLFDAIFPTSSIGRLAAPIFAARQALKGRIKRSPAMMRLAMRFNLAPD